MNVPPFFQEILLVGTSDARCLQDIPCAHSSILAHGHARLLVTQVDEHLVSRLPNVNVCGRVIFGVDHKTEALFSQHRRRRGRLQSNTWFFKAAVFCSNRNERRQRDMKNPAR